VHDRHLRRFREAIRTDACDLRLHAVKEMNEDALCILDVECCVLTGSIQERQRDRRTGEWKYVIHGWARDGREIAVVVTWLFTGKMAVLTVFRI
jgi:hypothetical protein